LRKIEGKGDIRGGRRKDNRGKKKEGRRKDKENTF
jgi:hypothetical protein